MWAGARRRERHEPEGAVSRLHRVLEGARRDHCPRGSYGEDVGLSRAPFPPPWGGMG